MGEAHARQEQDGGAGEAHCVRDIGELGAGRQDHTAGQDSIPDARRAHATPLHPQAYPRAVPVIAGHTWAWWAATPEGRMRCTLALLRPLYVGTYTGHLRCS
jgi:hypothetical protein